jgi:hypothetical protein
MKLTRGILLAMYLVLRAADLSKEAAVLDRDQDPQRLEAAAIAIAASNDSAAIALLGKHLGERSLLKRLDPAGGVLHLGRVFRKLAENPSPATAALCVALAKNEEFTAEPSRLNFLLNALAAFRPMSDEAAAVFRDTSQSDYLEVNGPLLAKNASPRALEVLAELFGDEELDAAQRVSIAHWGLLPVRTNADVAAMCARVMKAPKLSHKVQVAILESLYDYQPREWFGKRGVQPVPPLWKSAPAATRQVLTSLGTISLQRTDLPSDLKAAIQRTLSQLR